MTFSPWPRRQARRTHGSTIALAVVAAAMLVLGAGAAAAGSDNGPDKPGKEHWKQLGTKVPPSQSGAKADVAPQQAEAVELDRAGLP